MFGLRQEGRVLNGKEQLLTYNTELSQRRSVTTMPQSVMSLYQTSSGPLRR